MVPSDVRKIKYDFESAAQGLEWLLNPEQKNHFKQDEDARLVLGWLLRDTEDLIKRVNKLIDNQTDLFRSSQLH